MKFLLISDGHGAIDNLRALSAVAKGVDAVLFAGDFAAFNKPQTGQSFLEELKLLHNNIYSVLGNCDEPTFIEKLKECTINVQSEVKQFLDFMIVGSGGASKFTGATPNERTDEELAGDLTSCYEKKEGDNLILITHNPAHKLKVDKVAPLVHVGSPLIRAFIEKTQPVLAISGHIHEAYGVDRVGDTLVVNPGALCDGRFAIAEIVKENDRYKATVILKKL